MEPETIDRQALFRLYKVIGNDLEELEALREDYLVDAPELVSKICEGVECGDLDSARVSAHSLKSNARDLGATQLAELSAELELCCKDGEIDGLYRLVDRVKSAESLSRAVLAALDLKSVIDECSNS